MQYKTHDSQKRSVESSSFFNTSTKHDATMTSDLVSFDKIEK